MDGIQATRDRINLTWRTVHATRRRIHPRLRSAQRAPAGKKAHERDVVDNVKHQLQHNKSLAGRRADGPARA
jgi:hypothetical protein